MGAREERAREIIKERYGSILKMAEATGIPKTTIYHALDRGLDNTTTRIRTQIEYALADIGDDGEGEPADELTADERELVAIYRSLTPESREALMVVARTMAR